MSCHTGGVTGLGQDRRRSHGGQGRDASQPGQAELVQHGDHVRLDPAQLSAGALQVGELIGDPAQQPAAGAPGTTTTV